MMRGIEHEALVMYYRLNSEDSVQMVTALILQLIQSIIKLPGDDGDLLADDAHVWKLCAVCVVVVYNEGFSVCLSLLNIAS